MPRANPKRVILITSIALILALFGACATLRSEFVTTGEETMIGKNATLSPSSWQVGPENQASFVAAEEQGRAILRFINPAGAALSGSLVENFRMEFSLRLDAKVEYEIPTAMVNFRNYFNRRYCLIIEPEVVTLTAAKVRHGELADMKRYRTTTSEGAWHRYEIVAVGNVIKVFRDDALIIDVTDADDPVTSGNIWFESHSKYSFTDVVVARIGGFAKNEAATASSAAAGGETKNRVPLVVAGLKGEGVPSYEVSLFSDLYAAALVSTGAFRVIERAELDKVLAEQELQLSGLTDEAGAVKIGRIVNAEYLTTGSVGRLGGQGGSYVLSVKLIRIETGEIMAAARRTFTDPLAIPAGLSDMSAELAGKIRK